MITITLNEREEAILYILLVDKMEKYRELRKDALINQDCDFPISDYTKSIKECEIILEKLGWDKTFIENIYGKF